MGARRQQDNVAIEVHDTGNGIAEDQKEAIFQEFKRLEAAVQAEPGLGLGLSIVDRIVKMLGHDLQLSSKRGQGSVFTLVLPAAKSIAAISPVPVRPSPRGIDLRGMHVLCIDNEPKILDGMQRLMSGWGCAVQTAADFSAAREAALSRVDIVLADYHLDEGNGLDVIAGLRTQLGGDLPAILITADQSAEIREAAGLQNVSYIRKPIKPASLRALMARAKVHQAAAE